MIARISTEQLHHVTHVCVAESEIMQDLTRDFLTS